MHAAGVSVPPPAGPGGVHDMTLGCAGILTDGTVRDLDEVRRLGFQFFAGGVQVSHGYARLEAFGGPVTVFGMTVKSGDLIHADQHGAVTFPAAAARDVLAA